MADNRVHFGPPDGPSSMMDNEKHVQRNPHPDFKKVEASRPDWQEKPIQFIKAKNPDWKLGDGPNDGGECLKKEHVEIDPYADGRPAVFNYKLLISAITPRPIGFVGTRSKDGTSTNLAPFSYFSVVNHDPPLFTLGFAGGWQQAKDTLANLRDSGECTINIISEHYLEAANAASINAPFGVSEWALSGLHPAPCAVVGASRIKEAIFSVECKLYKTEEFESRATPGKKTGVLAIVEGVRFWAREDALNEQQNLLDPQVLRPVSRLGGISYGRTVEALELPRPDFEQKIKSDDAEKLKLPKAEGQ